MQLLEDTSAIRARIVIYTLRTWGAFGNFLAAKRLQALLLREHPGWRVSVVCADELLEPFAAVGRGLASRQFLDSKPCIRRRLYFDLISPIQQIVEHIERFGDPREDIVPLVADLVRRKPTVIVCTKGVLTRLVSVIRDILGLNIRLANYVTNPGLLKLALHRCSGADVHLIPFPIDRRLSLRLSSGTRDRIKVVGPLITRSKSGPRRDKPYTVHQNRPIIAILCNRGGDGYLDLMKSLTRFHDAVDIIFVASGDKKMYSRVCSLAKTYHCSTWRVHLSLRQRQLHSYLRELSRRRLALFVSKTGPNSMLEAACAGIPMILHKTGLPMEIWVPEFVHRHRIGRICSCEHKLASVVMKWLRNPSQILVARRAVLQLRRTLPTSVEVQRRILRAFRQLLA